MHYQICTLLDLGAVHLYRHTRAVKEAHTPMLCATHPTNQNLHVHHIACAHIDLISYI